MKPRGGGPNIRIGMFDFLTLIWHWSFSLPILLLQPTQNCQQTPQSEIRVICNNNLHPIIHTQSSNGGGSLEADF